MISCARFLLLLCYQRLDSYNVLMYSYMAQAFLPVLPRAAAGLGMRYRDARHFELAWARKPAPRRRVVSGNVASGRSRKTSKPPQLEMDCETYRLDGNILNQLNDKDLWKMTIEKQPCFMSFCVHASNLENGKLAARQPLRKGV